jgi:ATP-binding cassette, subfamily C (CFTR/MRP), member 1
VFCSLSYLEHARSIQPSTTLIAYLLFSTGFDIIRSRTLWLVAPDSRLTHLFTASIVSKALVLVLESVEKTKHLPTELYKGRPEETSSILNRSIFYWLNELMLRGSRHLLLPDDLYELNYKMTANQLTVAYISHWRRASKTSKDAALLTTFRTLKWQLLAAVFPRVILLALTMCQPILIQELLLYLSLVYTGTAVATGFYWYFQYRFLTMVRGCLVSAISWQTARLNIQAISDPKAAVTLMSTDIERITDGLRSLHDFWACTIQICVGLYLLQKQMGVACVVPIILAILSAAGTAWISGTSNKRQVTWMEAVQARIGVTSAMLSSIKGVKMRGLIEALTKTIQNFRVQEIKHGNGWRMLLVATIGMSFIPEYLSPVSTFMIYIIQARASGETFDTTRAFTTLSLLVIMTQPLNNLLQAIPMFVGAVGCCRRIGEFLSAEEQKDFRDIEGYDLDRFESQTMSEALADFPESIELTTRNTTPLSRQPARGLPIVRITDGCFGWAKNEDTLKDVNVAFPSGRLTCVVGPVASGKSTLCKTILGETRVSKGQVEFFAPSKEAAFCDQTAHLVNGTIKENIVGFSDPDAAWYDTVVEACALQEDVSAMPKQHDTPVGSGGVNLSGGQRQKVAIARALYARKAILVLDDVFSGFDAGGEQHVFRNVVGPDGLAQKQGMTVIFATHAVKFLPYTDHIIALGLDGRVVQEGSYNILRMQPGYVRRLAVEAGPHGQDTSATQAPIEIEGVKVAEQAAEQDLSRQLGDFAIYRYYFNAAGLVSTALLFAFGAACSTFFNLPTFWLKLWTDASSKAGQHDDYMYLGVYGVFQCLALVFLVLLGYQSLVVIASKTGINLHFNLLRTVANASLVFFSTTDSGAITNRFSQDMQLVDMQLPIGVVNLVCSVSIAIGQIILITASSPWVGLTFPFIFTVFYFVQKFYLRTSRQLRFLDLEAKSPLYTNFLETLSGLSTIRAFGWTRQNLALNRKLLDLSQKPNYLLYMIQRWLTFVVDMVVACLAIVIAGLAVSQRANGGFVGIALTQVMLVNLTLRGVIMSWTDVETSIGAVSRVKSFSENTPSENKPQETSEPAVDWPHGGRVECEAVTAIYETAPDKPALEGLRLTIEPGEKIGVCGRSGSGKSSLVLALFRMIEIQSGSLKIDDLDLQHIPRNIVRERLNVIPQDPLFLPGTIRSNLDPRNVCTNFAMIEALKRVQLWSTFEVRGGLDDDIRSDLLSHGQRQLFCLAAAILRKSKIVVLDEATSK